MLRLMSGRKGQIRTVRMTLTEPNQPNPKFIEVQKLANTLISEQLVQGRLHYCPRLKGVLCFYCGKAFSPRAHFTISSCVLRNALKGISIHFTFFISTGTI